MRRDANSFGAVTENCPQVGFIRDEHILSVNRDSLISNAAGRLTSVWERQIGGTHREFDEVLGLSIDQE